MAEGGGVFVLHLLVRAYIYIYPSEGSSVEGGGEVRGVVRVRVGVVSSMVLVYICNLLLIMCVYCLLFSLYKKGIGIITHTHAQIDDVTLFPSH